jgi:hypothetical protein
MQEDLLKTKEKLKEKKERLQQLGALHATSDIDVSENNVSCTIWLPTLFGYLDI